MVIKPPDDKRSRQDALLAEVALAASPEREAELMLQLQHLHNQISADRLITRELDFYFGDSPDWAIIHDLVLQDSCGQVTIRHLLINTNADVIIVERIHPADSLTISNQGHWKAAVQGTYRALDSPFRNYLLKQAALLIPLTELLHESLAARVLRRGVLPQFHCRIAVSKQCRILRPRSPIHGVEALVKADQLGLSIMPIGQTVPASERRLRSAELRQVAHTLARRHTAVG